MKRLLLIVFVLLNHVNFCKAQNTSIDFQVGAFSSPKLNFDWYSLIENKSTPRGFSNNFSLSVKSKMYKSVYLRSELGIKSARYFVDIRFPADPSNGYIGDYSWYGWYENARVYIGFMPEWRFAQDVVFINGGLLLCRDVVNGFDSGYEFAHDLNGGQFYDLSEMGHMKNNSYGCTFNFGINPVFNNIGVLVGAGFAYLSPVGIDNGSPKISIKTWQANLGISYKIN